MPDNVRCSWDDWLIAMATVASQRSPDLQTKHGAVLCDKKHRVLGIGYNGFPRGFDDATLPAVRPFKYEWMVHAEANCVLNSQNLLLGDGYTMAITGFPCPECMKLMIQSSVKKILYGAVPSNMIGEEERKRVMDLAKMAGVTIRKYKGNICEVFDILAQKVYDCSIHTNDCTKDIDGQLPFEFA